MKKNRFMSLLLSLAMVLPMLCTGAAASDIHVSGAADYLKKGDYFSIYPNSPEYTTYALTAERNPVTNAVTKGNKVQFWSIGTGKWCVQRITGDHVFAIMYVENREDHKGGSDGSGPKYWALDGDHTSSGTKIHMWEDSNCNDKEKTFYLEDDNDGDPETFYICSAYAYDKKGSRYIVPESTSFKNGTGVKLSSSGYSWRISIVSRATSANDNIDWMSQLDGRMPLSNVNIPGTHDSSTANVKASYAENANNYTCQMHFIDEQLNCGVRAFDIRYCKNGDDVYTCHGSGDIRCATPEYDGSHAMSVDWVMGKMTSFLNPDDENNKSKNETIIMVVKQDDGNKDAPKVMAKTLLDYKKYLYDWSNPSPTLNEVRGKIVIMSRTDFSGVVDAADLKYFGPNLTNWDDKYEDNDHWAQKIGKSDAATQVYIQDDYNCTDYNKMVQVENVIKQLNGKTDFKEVKDTSKIPSIPETAFCFNYSSKAYGDIDLNPLGSARTINSWLYGSASKYFKDGGWRTGITMTDYCDEVLCDLIIASNYGRVTGAHKCTFMDVGQGAWFHDFVEKAAELGLVKGMGDGTFSPETPMKSAMPIQILYNREGSPEVQIEDGFDPEVWYAPAVSWGIQQGLVKADGFDADAPMPRQDIMLMIYNYAKLKGYDVSAEADISGFADASQVSPEAEAAIRWIVGSGIVSGNDQNELLPGDNIKRAEAAKVFVNFAELYPAA